MGFNLTGTQVKNTYQRLAQISGSVLTNGTGSVITNLTVVASNATNAVNSLFAVTASYAAYAVSASHEIIKEVSSSYADTAGVANSVAYNRITGKPTLVSGSGQIVIGSTIGQLDGSRVEGALAGTVAYANVTGKPTLISGSAQIVKLGFAITGSNTFIADQEILGGVTASSAKVEKVTGTGSLSLQPDPADSRAFQIYNTSPADIHIKSNSQLAFFGDDTNYLKIDNNAGQIVIKATDEVYVDTDASVIGDLHVSGTFYPNVVSFFSSSIVQNTGSYVLTTDNVGTVQYDTYSQVAKAVQSDIQINSVSGNLSGSRVVGAIAGTIPYANVTSKPTLVSGSIQVTLQDTTYTDGIDKQFLQTNGAGDLAFADVATMYETVKNGTAFTIPKGTPLYVSGSQGANPIVYAADAANPAKMPAMFIAGDDIANGATGRGLVLGLIEGINLTGYTAGQEVFVAAGGGWTATRPTGTSIVQSLGIVSKGGNGGKGIVLNPGPATLPNIASGHFWVGNGSAFPTATSTGSFAKINLNNTFTGTQTFNNINVNGTGSFGYLLSVTGSVKKIGDAFIQLNTDSPAERYAGLIVIDSGSAQTGSLIYDSTTDHWGYKATDGHSSGFLSGPSSTLGSWQQPTANKVLKSLGDWHAGNSSITDTGAKVDFSTNVIVTGSVQASGGFVGNAQTATSASHALQADSAATATFATTAGSATTATTASFAFVSDLANQATSASYVAGQENYARKDQANTFTQRNSFNNGINLTGSLTFNSTNTYDGIDLFQGVFPVGGYSTPIRFFSGSVKKPTFGDNKWINMQVTPGNLPWLAISSFPENDHFMYFQPAYTSPSGRNRIAFESQISGFGSGLQVNDNLNVTGSLRTSSPAPGANVSVGMINITGNSFVNIAPFATSTQNFNNSRFGFVNQTRGTAYRQAFATENYNNTSYDNTTFGSGLYANGRGITLDFAPSGSATSFTNRSQILLQQAGPGTTVAALSATNVQIGPSTNITTGVIGIGNASLPTISMTAASGSFQGVTNARLNNVRVNGVLNVNGNTALTGTLTVANKTTFNDQVVGSVGTITPSAGAATLDCSLGNFFTMTLAAGSNVLLTPSNIHAGQTINLQITQNGTTAGTITFPSTVKFTDGIDYVATTSLNAVDVVTLVSFDGTNLLATAVKNLQ